MIRGFLTIFAFISVLLFPWPFAALVALGSSLLVPLLPVAVGLFADTLYYAPGAASFPYGTIIGALATAAAYLVRDRLAPDIID